MGYGFPYDDLPDWVGREDDADAEQAEREAREDRIADHTPAKEVLVFRDEITPRRRGLRGLRRDDEPTPLDTVLGADYIRLR
jgi:hypothetical protein